MRGFVLIITLIMINGVSAFCRGDMQTELVNMQEIDLDRIDTIEVLYRSENITIINNNADTLIIKEYMNVNNRDYYAQITNSGNNLSITAGYRPSFSTLRVNVEVFIPASNKSITIQTSSGKIEAAGVYTASSMFIESSSGSISVNAVTANRINIEASSGNINYKTSNGNTIVSTSSGRIVLGSMNGNVRAESSSGAIEINQVNGTLTARATSGSIRSGSVNGNAAINTSSGIIVLGGINGNVHAESSSGNVHCDLAENADDVSIKTASGSVAIGIPKNQAYNLYARTSSGRLHSPFSDKLFSPLSDKDSIQGVIGNVSDNETPKKITINTTSGSMRIDWIR